MSATAITVAGPSWFDRLVSRIKGAAKTVWSWVTRGSKAVGRGVKAVGSGLKTGASYAVRGVGYVGKGAFWGASWVLKFAVGVMFLVALAVVVIAFAIYGLIAFILSGVQWLLRLGFDVFDWMSKKGHSFKAVREANRAQRDQRYEAMLDRIAASIGSITYDEQAETWVPAADDQPEGYVYSDYVTPEQQAEQLQMLLGGIEMISDEVLAPDMDPYTVEWDNKPLSLETVAELTSISNRAKDKSTASYFAGRAWALESFLNSGEGWPTRERDKAMMIQKLKHSHHRKQLHLGFEDEAVVIAAKAKVNS